MRPGTLNADTGFALDTSGAVGPMPTWESPVPTTSRFLRWEALSPFAQGYVEALFGGAVWADTSKPAGQMATPYRFSDLAPETLALILRDCEAYKRQYVLPWYDGAEFWRGRNNGDIPARFFPPLTPYLGDDGRVYLREGR